MSISPLVGSASADETILLSTDVEHVVLTPGQSTNITLTVGNNGTSIESYNLSVDTGSLASYWTSFLLMRRWTTSSPTWSKNTTIVVRLDEGATVADSGSFTINVSEPDSGEFTHLMCSSRSLQPTTRLSNRRLTAGSHGHG